MLPTLIEALSNGLGQRTGRILSENRKKSGQMTTCASSPAGSTESVAHSAFADYHSPAFGM